MSEPFEISDNGEVHTDLRSFFASLGHYDYIVLGDTSHADRFLDKLFQSDFFLPGLKEAGVTVFGSEVDGIRHRFIESVYNRIPSTEFQLADSRAFWTERLIAYTQADSELGFMDNTAEIRANGLEVAFVDEDRVAWIRNTLIEAKVPPARAHLAGKIANKMASDPTLDATLRALREANASASFFLGAGQLLNRRVRESNRHIANNIQASKGDGPMAVLLGQTHMLRARGVDENCDGHIDPAEEMDIDELLGDNTVFIQIVEYEQPQSTLPIRWLMDGATLAARWAGDIWDKDTPDYIIYLDGNDGRGKIMKPMREEAAPDCEIEGGIEATTPDNIAPERRPETQRQR